MKIVYLAAGAAGMYCGTCLHDNTLATALLAAGDEILLTPAYTPLRTDEDDVSIDRIFFGGINVFLQEKLALFRHTPWWLDRLADSRWLLNKLSRRAGATRPESLGALTVSMLQGDTGRQKKELEKLRYWLEHDVRPDVIHLSNSMLLGFARTLRWRLSVPLVCSLSGEDVFLEKLPPPHYQQARSLLRERAQDVDAFVALNRYYAKFMSDYLALKNQRVEVIPHGLMLDGHVPRKRATGGASETFTIGYLGRICHDKGLHVLARAFVRLCADRSLPKLKLRVAGYLGEGDRPYLAEIERELTAAGVVERYEYAGELTRREKLAFLSSLDVMSLPTVYRESKGLPVLEAWASAVPVVVPAHGAFPEMVADTGGGLLCRPDDPRSLAEMLAQLADDPQQTAELGRLGREAVVARYHAEGMARRHRELYQELACAGKNDQLRDRFQPTK